MRTHRIDVGHVDASALAKAQTRADGSILVEARLTRTGVFAYRDDSMPGGVRREYRPAQHVFDAASLATFKLVPVTNDHPPVMVTAQNARQYQVGTVGENIRRDGIYMVAPLVVNDAATIADMRAGKTQVSNGYDCDLVMTPGTSPEGERYDAVQTNIVGNHLAIVSNARAGKEAAVRMDAAISMDIDSDDDTRQPRTTKDHAMDLTQALAALQAANEKNGAERARADAAIAERDALKANASKLEAERDALKERADAADKARKDAIDGQGAAVTARVALLTSAGKVLRGDSADDLSGKSNTEIKLAVIEHVTGKKYDAAKGDAYIDARYDAAIETAAESADTFRKVDDVIASGRKDSKRSDAADAYDKMVEHNRNAWRTAGDKGSK